MPPNCDHIGELIVGAIGSPPDLYADARLSLVEPAMFRELLAPRAPAGHKGTYGHVLVVAGSRGKTGAAAMAGMAALRAGAGLVTVASAESAIAEISSHAPELMTEPLPKPNRAASRSMPTCRVSRKARAWSRSDPAWGARRTSPRWCTRWLTPSTARWYWTPMRW